MGAHGGGGNQFGYLLAVALRTNGRGIRWRQNQLFKTVTTAFTLIFIDRHRFFLLQRNAFIDGFGRLVKINPRRVSAGAPGGNLNFNPLADFERSRAKSEKTGLRQLFICNVK
jgi:hypothetical protein